MDKQWKAVPVDPMPEMIAAAYAGGPGAGPGADYAAMLAAAPQPPSASDECKGFEKWRHTQADSLRRCGYPDAADAFIRLGSVQWAGWQARAALAPSPGVDAVEQKPGKFKLGDVVRKSKGSQWHGTVVGTYSTTLTPEGYAVESSTERGSVQIYPTAALVSAEPSPAASADEWMAEAEKLADEYAKEFRDALNGPTYAAAIRRAALLAHLKARP